MDAEKRTLLKDNRGLTLVELIIAVTLLVVVSAILLGFVVTGTNLYKNVSAELDLQFQSQTVSALLREYLIDCNYAVCVEETDTDNDGVIDVTNLYVRNKNEVYETSTTAGSTSYTKTETYKLYKFSLVGNTLSLVDVVNEGGGSGEVISDNISVLTIQPVTVSATDDTLKSLHLVITLTKNNKSYTSEQTITFRNTPKYYTSYNSMMGIVTNTVEDTNTVEVANG